MKPKLNAAAGGKGSLALTDLPKYTREVLGLYGLNVSTDLLVGADHRAIDKLRESADKASCPCLVLVETGALAFAGDDEAKAEAAAERMRRVIQAAHRLGCNSAAMTVSGDRDASAVQIAADRIKALLQGVDRIDLNLLVMSGEGVTKDPDKLTDLIKKIGGFRIGTFPDFEQAARAADAQHYLRRLTPYASALTASSVSFKTGKGGPVHQPYDLIEMAKTVLSVGYQGTLAIDYRGEGDPEEGIAHTKAVLTAALGKEVETE
ncbi:MAG: TIM barrel protein [Phycisphaerales bacterium]